MYLVKDLLEGRGMAFCSRGAAHGEAGGRTVRKLVQGELKERKGS